MANNGQVITVENKIDSIQFKNVIKNDTFSGFNCTVLDTTTTSTPVDLTGYTIKMYLRHLSKTGPISKQLETGSGITITDATAGKFSILPFVTDIEEGKHLFDIEFNNSGTITTWLEGAFFIVQDVTFDD
jgi:hypothetical protein